MFKKFTVATFVLALTLPVATFAMESMDLDADGQGSADEFASAYPDALTGTFEQIDLNTDGALGVEGIAAAREVAHPTGHVAMQTLDIKDRGRVMRPRVISDQSTTRDGSMLGCDHAQHSNQSDPIQNVPDQSHPRYAGEV